MQVWHSLSRRRGAPQTTFDVLCQPWGTIYGFHFSLVSLANLTLNLPQIGFVRDPKSTLDCNLCHAVLTLLGVPKVLQGWQGTSKVFWGALGRLESQCQTYMKLLPFSGSLILVSLCSSGSLILDSRRSSRSLILIQRQVRRSTVDLGRWSQLQSWIQDRSCGFTPKTRS